MNSKTTVILLVLLVAVLGIVANYHWNSSKPAQLSESAGENYVIKGLGEIYKLQLESKDTPKIVLERKDDKKWYLTSPVSAPASDNQVARTVGNLTVMAYERKFGPKDADRPGEDLTGLSSPERISATVTDDKGKSVTVLIGRNRPASTQSYVQVAGDPDIYVTSLNVTELLAKTPEDFRDTAIFDFEPTSVDRVEARGVTNFAIRRTPTQWTIESPIKGPADTKKVQALVQSLADLKAERFVNDNPSPADLKGYGLDNPHLTLTVEIAQKPTVRPSQGASQPASAANQMAATQAASAPTSTPAPASKPAGKLMSIAFGAATGGKTFAKLSDQPWVFQVAQTRTNDLQPKVDTLRDLYVLDLANKMPMEVEIALAHAQGVKLERGQAGQWQMVAPYPGPADQEAVAKLLATLYELKASEFIEPQALGALGLDPPNGKIVIRFKDSEQPAVLLLGGSTGESGQAGFVREEGSSSAAVVPSNDFAVLNLPAPAYWPLRLLEVSPFADFASIRIEKPDSSAVEIKRFGRDDFRMVEPLGATVDLDSLRNLLEELRDFRATKMISLGEALPERFTKLKPIRVMISTVSLVPPTQTQPATASSPASAPATTSAPATEPASQPAILLVRDGNRAYAWIEGRNPVAVGEISPKTYTAFDAELRNRMVFPIDPAKVVSLKVSLEKNSMEFLRSGETWRYTDDPFLKVEPDRINRYLFELARLKARRYVDYAKPKDVQKYGLDNPAMTIEVKYDTGEPMKLNFSRTGPVGVDGLYGMSSMIDGVFVLAPDSPRKMQAAVQKLKEPAAPPQMPPPQAPMMQPPAGEEP